MARTYFLLVCFLSAALAAKAQSIRPPVTPGFLYERETAVNFKLTTNRGIAPGIEFGRLRTYYRTTFFQASIGDIRHSKEQRIPANPSVSRSFRPYIFGKQNNLIAARAAWGIKRYYSEKARTKGVALGISYAAGPTLGILKPYYLALRYEGSGTSSRVVHEKYSETNKDVFLDNTKILGASPFTRGLGEVTVTPGGNAMVALHMDWGAFDEFLKALEIGVMADVFIRKTPVLVSDDQNYRTFVNFFVNLQFGKRR
jgi:hypothetical protein